MWPFKLTKLSQMKKQIGSALANIDARLDCNAKRIELLMDRVSALEKSGGKTEKYIFNKMKKMKEELEKEMEEHKNIVSKTHARVYDMAHNMELKYNLEFKRLGINVHENP